MYAAIYLSAVNVEFRMYEKGDGKRSIRIMVSNECVSLVYK